MIAATGTRTAAARARAMKSQRALPLRRPHRGGDERAHHAPQEAVAHQLDADGRGGRLRRAGRHGQRDGARARPQQGAARLLASREPAAERPVVACDADEGRAVRYAVEKHSSMTLYWQILGVRLLAVRQRIAALAAFVSSTSGSASHSSRVSSNPSHDGPAGAESSRHCRRIFCASVFIAPPLRSTPSDTVGSTSGSSAAAGSSSRGAATAMGPVQDPAAAHPPTNDSDRTRAGRDTRIESGDRSAKSGTPVVVHALPGPHDAMRPVPSAERAAMRAASRSGRPTSND